MSIKLANKFLEDNKNNQRLIRQYSDRKSEEYELVPKIKDRRISSIFRVKERKVDQFTIDCITTLIIYYSSFILGWVVCHNKLVHREFDQILPSNSYSKSTIYRIAFVFGSLLSSLSVNLLGRQISCAQILAMICLTQVLTFKSEWFTFIITLLEELSSGALFVILIAWIIEIWRDKSRPYLQSFFFFICLATFLEPVIQKQYIFVNKNNDDFGCSANASYVESNSYHLSVFHNNSNHSEKNIAVFGNQVDQENISLDNSCNKTYKSNIPEICIGFLSLCGSAFLIILYESHKQYIEKNRIKLRSKRFRKNRVFVKRFSFESLKSWKTSFFIISISILFSSYLLIEFSSIKLMSKYWHSFDPKLTESELSLIRMSLYGSQTLFACLFILITIVLKPQIILMFNLFVITVANFTLIIFATNSYIVIIIVCSLMGCGFASSSAAIFTILEQYMHIDYTIGSLVVSMSAIIYVAIYELSENLINNKNTLFYICLNLTCAIFMLSIYTLIWSSKFFINSESFTLKRPQMSPRIECSEFKFVCEENEQNDSFCSIGSYQPRDTSIVSI